MMTAGIVIFGFASVASLSVGVRLPSNNLISQGDGVAERRVRPVFLIVAGALGFAEVTFVFVEAFWSLLLMPLVSIVCGGLCLLFSITIVPPDDRRRIWGFVLAGL